MQHERLKRIIIEMDDGMTYEIPNANILEFEGWSEAYSEPLVTVSDHIPPLERVIGPVRLFMRMLIVSDEMTMDQYIAPEELSSGPKLVEDGNI